MSAFDIIGLLILYVLLGSCAFMFICLGWCMFEETKLGEIFMDLVEEKFRRKEE